MTKIFKMFMENVRLKKTLEKEKEHVEFLQKQLKDAETFALSLEGKLYSEREEWEKREERLESGKDWVHEKLAWAQSELGKWKWDYWDRDKEIEGMKKEVEEFKNENIDLKYERAELKEQVLKLKEKNIKIQENLTE